MGHSGSLSCYNDISIHMEYHVSMIFSLLSHNLCHLFQAWSRVCNNRYCPCYRTSCRGIICWVYWWKYWFCQRAWFSICWSFSCLFLNLCDHYVLTAVEDCQSIETDLTPSCWLQINMLILSAMLKKTNEHVYCF